MNNLVTVIRQKKQTKRGTRIVIQNQLDLKRGWMVATEGTPPGPTLATPASTTYPGVYLDQYHRRLLPTTS